MCKVRHLHKSKIRELNLKLTSKREHAGLLTCFISIFFDNLSTTELDTKLISSIPNIMGSSAWGLGKG